MTRERKYAIFVIVVSVCYLALPYMQEAGLRSEHDAEKTVTILFLSLIAQLFYVFYLDILLIVLPLSYMMLKTILRQGKLNVYALLLLAAFFAAVYLGDVVCYKRFSNDLILEYNSYQPQLHIVPDAHISLQNFVRYTWNLPMAYYNAMDANMQDKVWHYLPGLAARVLLSIALFITTLLVTAYTYFFKHPVSNE